MSGSSSNITASGLAAVLDDVPTIIAVHGDITETYREVLEHGQLNAVLPETPWVLLMSFA